MRTVFLWLHLATGVVAGVVILVMSASGVLGQTLAGVASAGASVLVWTGLALSWRQFFQRPGRPGS